MLRKMEISVCTDCWLVILNNQKTRCEENWQLTLRSQNSQNSIYVASIGRYWEKKDENERKHFDEH